jgi:hypothetical protein
MFPRLIARENEWNRKYNFTDVLATGFLMDWKMGMAFFGWRFSDGDIRFYKCEQEVFEKNFRALEETVEHEMDPFDNPHFLRYPKES